MGDGHLNPRQRGRDRRTVSIVGSKNVIAAPVTGRNFARANVRGLVPEWRTGENEDENFELEIVR